MTADMNRHQIKPALDVANMAVMIGVKLVTEVLLNLIVE